MSYNRLMVFRWLIRNWIRQQAREKVSDAVRQAVDEAASRATSESGSEEGGAVQAPPACEIGFVFALGAEAGGLVDRLSGAVTNRGAHLVDHLGTIAGRRVAIVESGVGPEAAARGTEDLIAVRRPQWVFSAGLAGALRAGLKRGHILMADSVADTRGRRLSVGLKMDADALAAVPGLHVGRLLTVDRLVRTPAEKRSLGERHEALACDMETMAVAEVCRRRQVRFMAVRVISDAVDDHLPPYIETLLRQKSVSGRLGAAAGAIFSRPSSVGGMWKLKEDALKASDRLAKFLIGILPQLEPEKPRQLPDRR